MKLMDLMPGDLVEMGFGRSAVLVAQTDHPLRGYPFRLAIWKLDDGSWSHDCLDHRQDVGQRKPSSVDERIERLRSALQPGRNAE